MGQFFGRLLTVANCGLTRRNTGDSIDFYRSRIQRFAIVGSSKDFDKVFNEGGSRQRHAARGWGCSQPRGDGGGSEWTLPEIGGVREHHSAISSSDEARRGLVRFLHRPPRDTLLRMQGGGLFCGALQRGGRAGARV